MKATKGRGRWDANQCIKRLLARPGAWLCPRRLRLDYVSRQGSRIPLCTMWPGRTAQMMKAARHSVRTEADAGAIKHGECALATCSLHSGITFSEQV